MPDAQNILHNPERPKQFDSVWSDSRFEGCSLASGGNIYSLAQLSAHPAAIRPKKQGGNYLLCLNANYAPEYLKCIYGVWIYTTPIKGLSVLCSC